tara:strand:- start:648 stop:875 length:228 start_codon:yes stop_codon:yes gene_type:complete
MVHQGKKQRCEEWVLSLTNTKTEMGISVPILNEELDEMVKQFPFINTRKGTYTDLKHNTTYDYESGQNIMKRGEN